MGIVCCVSSIIFVVFLSAVDHSSNRTAISNSTTTFSLYQVTHPKSDGKILEFKSENVTCNIRIRTHDLSDERLTLLPLSHRASSLLLVVQYSWFTRWNRIISKYFRNFVYRTTICFDFPLNWWFPSSMLGADDDNDTANCKIKILINIQQILINIR